MKAYIKKNRLFLRRAAGELLAYCPFGCCGCMISCPHLDDSDPAVIRLTCGGTDVVFDRVAEDLPEQKSEE
ncbi:MAG: hypothetical protein PHI85_09250 [Victivallaceae bacterium]|nr:hypothetical protein [Victivallaceae bacterium]